MPHLLLLLVAACQASNPSTATEPPAAEVAAPRTPISIKELRTRPPSDHVVSVDAWVSRIYQCPPCPEDAQCKPCMGNNVVLSDEEKKLEDWNLTDTDAIVFLELDSLRALHAGDRVGASLVVREPPAPNGDSLHVMWVSGTVLKKR